MFFTSAKLPRKSPLRVLSFVVALTDGSLHKMSLKTHGFFV